MPFVYFYGQILFGLHHFEIFLCQDDGSPYGLILI